jgi:ABC-type transport system involved in multi-copper enzyme maturation permease subunit
MLAGPVLSFELITSARRTRLFLWRVAYATLLFALLVLIYLSVFGAGGANSILAASQYARAFFQTFATVQLLAVLVLGPALAAGAIARERERRTIEYLFTTHLTDAEIVGHKFLASIVQLACAMLVGLPVLSLAMLLGGISIDVLLAASLITLSTIGMVAAVSLAASVLARRARDAVVATYALLLAWMLGPMVLGMLLRGSGLVLWVDAALELLQTANPFAVLSKMLANPSAADSMLTSASSRWLALWTMMIVHAAIGAAALLFCWWGLRRLGGERAVTEKSLRRRLHRKRAPGAYAIAWREMHAGRSHRGWAKAGRAVMVLLIVAAIAGSCWRFYLSAVTAGEEFVWFQVGFATLLGFCAMTLIAAWAASSIGAEREAETWVTMMATPVSSREMLAGKIAGSIYAARPALVPLVVLWVLGGVDDPRSLAALPFTLAAMAVLSLAAATVGVGFSLWCASSTRALGMTLGSGLAIVLVSTCCTFPFIAINPVYLMAFPGAMNYAMWEADWGSPSEPFMLWFMAVYLVFWIAGLVAYLGLVWLLWAMLVGNFDRLAGRAIERPLIYAEDLPVSVAAPTTAIADPPQAIAPAIDRAQMPQSANEPAAASWEAESP